MHHAFASTQRTFRIQERLCGAITAKDLPTIQACVEEGVDVNLPHGLLCPLHLAAISNDVTTLAFLLDHCRAKVNVVDSFRMTALHYAAMRSQEMTSLLLEHGAGPSVADSQGVTPLHVAVRYGNLAVCEELLMGGSNPDVVDRSGETPLHIAARNLSLSAIKLLLQFNAQPNTPSLAPHPVELLIRNISNNMNLFVVQPEKCTSCLRALIRTSGHTVCHLTAQLPQVVYSSLYEPFSVLKTSPPSLQVLATCVLRQFFAPGTNLAVHLKRINLPTTVINFLLLEDIPDISEDTTNPELRPNSA